MASPSDATLKKLNDTLLKKLECPVCLNTCITHIYMCTNGHNLCAKCQQADAIAACPTCRAPGKPSVRNRDMEELASLVVIPCKYKSRGCPTTMTMVDVDYHDTICNFRYQCLIDNCKWFGKNSNLLLHVTQTHPFSVRGYKNNVVEVDDLTIDIPDRIHLIANSDVMFWMCCHTKDSIVNLYARYIGPDAVAAQFDVEFTMRCPEPTTPLTMTFRTKPLSLSELEEGNLKKLELPQRFVDKLVVGTGVNFTYEMKYRSNNKVGTKPEQREGDVVSNRYSWRSHATALN